MDHEEERHIEDIRQSSSFVLDDVFQSKEEMKEKLQKFQNDFDEEFDDIEERIFVQNIISYLEWRLEKRENAFKSVKIVEELEKKPHLITHCNKILFNIESGKHFLSNELLKDMINNDHFKQKRTRSQAVAEIGYCYSRLGPKHHDKAVRLLKEAIVNITPERNILWEFRLALTLRRQTHMFQMTTPAIFKPAERKREAAFILYEIVKFRDNDNRDLRYIKARALCELSNILFIQNNLFEIINTEREETEKITAYWCFEEAMKLYPNLYFVLQEYGRYLRYTHNLEKSKEMLEKAIELNDTVYSRHHLALTLKRMVEVATSRPSVRKKFQYPMDGDDQSNHDSRVCNKSSKLKSKKIDSFSADLEKLVVNSIQYVNVPSNETLPSTFHERESTNFVLQHENNFHKGEALASEISFFVPKIDKVSKPPFKIKSHSLAQKDDKKREQKRPFFDVFDTKRIFNSSRKSPKSVCVSPHHPLLLQAMNHLQKAVEMSKEYDGTRFDLGLIYRMLDRPDDALKCFSFITSSNCGNPSRYPMYVINAYEQQAFCKQDLLAKETDPAKKDELQYDVKKCAWKALTIVTGVIGAIPMLKRSNQCFPTLKELLQNEDNSSKKLKELAKLHELLDYDEESIKIYEEIMKEKHDAGTLRKLAQTYVKIRDFKNAICTLSLLQRMSEANISDKLVYIDTCIKGANHSLIEDDDLEMAKIRFLYAYKAILSHQNVSTPRNEENEISHDILILHSCGEDDCCYQKFVTSTLKTFVQLKFAVNDDDCPVSRRRFGYLIEAMCKSPCIFIFHHKSNKDNTDELIDRAMEIACVQHNKKILQIRTQEVEQYAPGCKEIVLTCGYCDIVNNDSQYLLKGDLFSNMLDKLSEMFLGESADFEYGNQLWKCHSVY